MSENDLTRRFFYKKFLLANNLSDSSRIHSIEKYARENGGVVAINVAKSFVANWKVRWNKCKRVQARLEASYKDWLDKALYAKLKTTNDSAQSSTGRKRSAFEALSESQKRRRTTELRKEEGGVLAYATSSTLRKEGKLKAAALLQEASVSPGRAEEILVAYRTKKADECTDKMSSDQALALAMDCGLSKNQYLLLRKNLNEFQANILPNYQKLLEAKKRCYPEKTTVSEQEATVDLQCLLNHTCNRLILNLPPTTLPPKMVMYYKWGFDGSSGHTEFKQVFDNAIISDSTVLITTLVRIRLVSACDQSVVWENPTASSTRYCRAIRIAYEKESPDTVKREYERMQSEISRLISTEVIVGDTSHNIDHELFVTMIDGKTINTLEDNKASSRCYICQCGPKDMNDLANVKIKSNTGIGNKLKYGISPLHARIKFFEYLLHLSYRLHLPDKIKKKGARKNADEKLLLEQRKSQIQPEFKKQLGLIVDMPKPGFGSSNDGNTARKFFDNVEIAAKITGIDATLIHRFAIILTAINTSKQLDPDEFGRYAVETAKILRAKYDFWPMSPTVHKVLIHGAEIISNAIVPVGQLSEEASEHRNKDFKMFRNQYSRRDSRISNLTDIFNRFFITSDPFITQLRASTKKQAPIRQLPEEVQSLLKESAKNREDEPDFEDDERV